MFGRPSERLREEICACRGLGVIVFRSAEPNPSFQACAGLRSPQMTGPGQHRQEEVYVAGMRGRRPRIPVGAARLEEKARERMSPEAFAYVAGGAGLGRTMAANLAAFERRRIVPRMLR